MNVRESRSVHRAVAAAVGRYGNEMLMPDDVMDLVEHDAELPDAGGLADGGDVVVVAVGGLQFRSDGAMWPHHGVGGGRRAADAVMWTAAAAPRRREAEVADLGGDATAGHGSDEHRGGRDLGRGDRVLRQVGQPARRLGGQFHHDCRPTLALQERVEIDPVVAGVVQRRDHRRRAGGLL